MDFLLDLWDRAEVSISRSSPRHPFLLATPLVSVSIGRRQVVLAAEIACSDGLLSVVSLVYIFGFCQVEAVRLFPGYAAAAADATKRKLPAIRLSAQV